ncbi:unnamed protein product [Allacma fusca]|uniref:MAM domain-containing protein n=1 Tax=Allacma fusca TaxID=39272 RepID=A0A8J2LR88_9HEXA|nr:unnamed protein product [Allacma fusca]
MSLHLAFLGHFLLLAFSVVGNASIVYHITSPWYQHTEDTCYLEAKIHMHNMQDGSIKMLLTTQNHTVWEPMNILGNHKNMWEKITQRIGKTRQPTQVILEITPSSKIPAHVAIDDIRLVQCFQDGPPVGQNCSKSEFRCSNNMCIHRNKVCNFYKDCPYGEDEKQNCGKDESNLVPIGKVFINGRDCQGDPSPLALKHWEIIWMNRDSEGKNGKR